MKINCLFIGGGTPGNLHDALYAVQLQALAEKLPFPVSMLYLRDTAQYENTNEATKVAFASAFLGGPPNPPIMRVSKADILRQIALLPAGPLLLVLLDHGVTEGFLLGTETIGPEELFGSVGDRPTLLIYDACGGRRFLVKKGEQLTGERILPTNVSLLAVSDYTYSLCRYDEDAWMRSAAFLSTFLNVVLASLPMDVGFEPRLKANWQSVNWLALVDCHFGWDEGSVAKEITHERNVICIRNDFGSAIGDELLPLKEIGESVLQRCKAGEWVPHANVQVVELLYRGKLWNTREVGRQLFAYNYTWDDTNVRPEDEVKALSQKHPVPLWVVETIVLKALEQEGLIVRRV
eukprot:TRINITY_DN16041_c0_g1_i1.p1 TRINITY_DN16041_c0_g1~~TRINITY_DN16041_c0_g1_i1.p1  ORF type:complete len:349 (-),score=45.01 TRINITY_DN16041_c0_g1_i1:108-1154(-)